jgi:hypothetical protein
MVANNIYRFIVYDDDDDNNGDDRPVVIVITSVTYLQSHAIMTSVTQPRYNHVIIYIPYHSADS